MTGYVSDAVISERPGCKFVRAMGPGEQWMPHPAGGIIVCHPERKPLWCHTTEDGRYVQEWLEPAAHRDEPAG